MHEEHGRDRRRYTSRLREQLLRYFPAFLELEGDLDADWKLELLERALTPRSAATLSKVHVTKILQRNRVRGRDAREILAVLQQQAVITSPRTIKAAAAHVTALLANIRLAKQLEKEAKAHIESITDRLVDLTSDNSELASDASAPTPVQTATQRDAAILLSFPGIGRLNLATLLTEAFESVCAAGLWNVPWLQVMPGQINLGILVDENWPSLILRVAKKPHGDVASESSQEGAKSRRTRK
jgi:hypothetical protein